MRNGPPQTCRYVEEPEPSLSGRVGLIKKLAVPPSRTVNRGDLLPGILISNLNKVIESQRTTASSIYCNINI